MLDSYESVRHAVWDFLKIEGAVNALNLANLVGDMIRTEKGEIVKKNETDLFHTKQDLGDFTDFEHTVAKMPAVKTARQVLEYRKQLALKQSNKTSIFDTQLKGLLSVPPPSKENKK